MEKPKLIKVYFTFEELTDLVTSMHRIDPKVRPKSAFNKIRDAFKANEDISEDIAPRQRPQTFRGKSIE